MISSGSQKSMQTSEGADKGRNGERPMLTTENGCARHFNRIYLAYEDMKPKIDRERTKASPSPFFAVGWIAIGSLRF